MGIRAVIFDLDGVIISTDECHYRSWKRLADEEGIYFDKLINQRLRGVSRVESLNIILEKSTKTYTPEQKQQLTDRKNCYYREFVNELKPSDILPGVMDLLTLLKAKGIKTAIASSSKNCPLILERIGLTNHFDAVVDGNHISKSKPDPEVFLLAAQKMNTLPEDCLVIEDAKAGVEGALAAGMKVIGIGAASESQYDILKAADISSISVDCILNT